MVLIVFRSSLETDVQNVLKAAGVQAYTDFRHVVGVGEAGARLDTFERPGSNSMILAALSHEDATRLVERLRSFRDASTAGRHGVRVPLRAFVLPCSQAI